MKKIFISLLLLVCQGAFGQDVVQVMSGNGFMQNLQQSGGAVYAMARSNGLIKLNEADQSLIVYNGANSPLTSQNPYKYQVYNSDTLLVCTGFASWWLYTSGFWQNLQSYNRDICIANDGRIFRNDSAGAPGLEEYVNNQWQLAADSSVQGITGISFSANTNNDIYISCSTASLKYSNGMWSAIPAVHDSLNSVTSPFIKQFDNHYNVYYGVNGVYYQLINNQWAALPLVTYGNADVVGFFRDSAENLYYLIDSTNPNTGGHWDWIKTVTGGMTYSYDISYFAGTDYGAYGITGTDTGNIYIATSSRLYHGGLNSGFTEEPLSNCIALTDLDGPLPLALECNRRFYFYAGNNFIGVLDSAMNMSIADSLSMNGTNVNADEQAAPYILRDNKGQLWIPESASGALKNLLTGNEVSVQAQNNGFVMGMRDSASYWLYSNQGLGFWSNNGLSHVDTLPVPIIMYYFTDSTGNLWFDCRDNYSVVVYRLNKQGVLQQFMYKYSTSINDYYQHYVTVDNNGDAWVRQNDSLVRYRGENANPFVMNLPHNYNQGAYRFQISDSTEMVISDEYNVYYYHNGAWKIAPDKMESSAWVAICSNHQSKVTFFTDEDGIVVYDFNAPPITNGNLLQGIVYADTNGNHYMDTFEYGLPLQSVTVNGNVYSTNNFGQYSLNVLNGNYTIKLNPPPYYTVYPDSYYVQTTNNFHRFDTLNFGCTASQQVNDLAVSLTPGVFTYGYLGQLSYTVSNYGTAPANATLQLRYDSTVTLNFSSVPASDTAPGLVTVPLGIIYPQQQVNQYFWFNMPAQFAYTDSLRDTIVRFYATVLPVVGDTTPANNTDTMGAIVVWSFDPNYKAVSPSGLGIYNTVETNQILTYAIHFQNTGTAPAVNITVKDTLDDKLDISTFKYLGSSDTNSYHITGRILVVNFNNINLPDSATGFINSQGYFKYSIQPKQSSQYGQQVNNSAAIYFDFNSPVKTNNTVVTFGPVVYATDTGASHATSATFIFPNPAGNYLNFVLRPDFDLPATISVIDNTGKVMLTQRATSLFGQISLASLGNSTYIFRVTSNKKADRLKFVKMK